MYCNAIVQSYHPENAATKLRPTPEPYTVVRLSLNAYGVLNDPDAPFLL